MNIEEMFGFLIKDYNLFYQKQNFPNCYGGWDVEIHSFYNESGCFSIYIEFQRGMSFWYASRFSADYEKICEREVNVSSLEPQLWEKFERKWIIKNPFFWWNNKKVLCALAEIIKIHLSKNKEFFGIRV